MLRNAHPQMFICIHIQPCSPFPDSLGCCVFEVCTCCISQYMNNSFGEYVNNVSNVASTAKMFLPGITDNLEKSVPYERVIKLIFNPEVRAYFDISQALVAKKIKKVVFPFFKSDDMDELRKPELYLPIISLMTFILFSAFTEGLNSSHASGFNPNIGKKIMLCLCLTMLEVAAAKCTRFAMSNIQMGVLDLTSFMSYRFVGLALSSVTYAILKVLGIPVVNKVLLVYFVLAETYFYYSELKSYLQERIVNTRDLSNSTLTLIHLAVSLVLVLLL